MFRTTRILTLVAALAAIGPISTGHAAAVPSTSSSQVEARHVVDRWFMPEPGGPAQIHERYLDAINRGDVATAAGLFSPNAMYHGGGCQPDPCVGLTAIAQEVLTSVLTNTHASLRTADVSGDRLVWSGDLDSDTIRAAGFDHVATLGTLRTDGDVIVDYRLWFDTSDPMTALFVQDSEPTYQRAPAAPEPDTKHALD